MNDNYRQDLQWTPERIHGLRQALNRTQREMAALIGVTERTIFRWEKGKSQPRHKTIRRLKKIEGRLITRNSKEQENPAPVLKKYEGLRLNEIRENRLKVHDQTRIRFRETVKALQGARKIIQQTSEFLPELNKSKLS